VRSWEQGYIYVLQRSHCAGRQTRAKSRTMAEGPCVQVRFSPWLIGQEGAIFVLAVVTEEKTPLD
jgi:hypothetical protein